MNSPVFFDGTGKRRRLVGRLTALLLALIVIGAVLFATTIADMPAASPLTFGREREQPLPFRTHLARRLTGSGGISPGAAGPGAAISTGRCGWASTSRGTRKAPRRCASITTISTGWWRPTLRWFRRTTGG